MVVIVNDSSDIASHAQNRAQDFAVDSWLWSQNEK